MKLLKIEDEALKRAHEYLERVETIIPMSTRDTAPADVVGGLLSVSLQHHDSILLLLKTRKNQASIEALLRTSCECLYRLLWIAEDEQRAKQVSDGTAKFPRFSALTKRLATKQKADLKPLSDAITMLHAYSHGGLEQLVNYYPRGRAYKRNWESVIGLYGVACFVGVMAIVSGLVFCSFVKREDSLKQLSDLYLESSLTALGDVTEMQKRMAQKQLKKNARAARQSSSDAP